MATRLCDLRVGEEETLFALLSQKTKKLTRTQKPYWSCAFRDNSSTISGKIWSNADFFEDMELWPEGEAYRLVATLEHSEQYGPDLRIREMRPVNDSDLDAGLDPATLYPSSLQAPDVSWKKLRELLARSLTDPHLSRLVDRILQNHDADFGRIQAAESLHHAYPGGLLEHVWSLTRLAVFVADHYARYYDQLDPPLNRSMIIAAIVLHDIGKLKELHFTPAQAHYTTEGRLIGHIVLGRDMVRAAAQEIEGFPEETLMQLEHAILAHHGVKTFGSPVEPQTLEALIVSQLDLLDAKVNSVALELMKPGTSTDAWTDRIYACENRRFYRGRPKEPGIANESGDEEGST